jgi:NADH dehydrogenase [ubiquinone] 1 alpha subcomplex assembly factor 5
MAQFFDRNRLRLHRERASFFINNHDFLIRFSTEDIIERINRIDFTPQKIWEFGARHGLLTKNLMLSNESIITTDISENMLKLNPSRNKFVLDEESVDNHFNTKFDLVVSVLNLHWINDIQKFLAKIFLLLNDDGVFIASFFGGKSLYNLRTKIFHAEDITKSGHSSHIAPFMRMEDMYRLLQIAGFNFIVVDNENIEVEYDTTMHLMSDVRHMGESSNSFYPPYILPKKVLEQLQKNKEKITEEFEIITFTASKKNLKISAE